MGAERVPRLDGIVYINDDGSGIPRYELMKQRETPVRYSPHYVRGPRPQGWVQAMEVLSERSSKLLNGGLNVPEC